MNSLLVFIKLLLLFETAESSLVEGNSMRSERSSTKVTKRHRILYSIQTSAKPQYAQKLSAQLKTWAAGLSQNELQIIGRTAPEGQESKAHWDPATGCVDDHFAGGPCKDAVAIVNAFKSGVDYVVLVGDDNYVVTKNMRDALEKRGDPGFPAIYGIPGCGADKCPGHRGCGLCGGGGQIYSRGMLKRLLVKGPNFFMKEHQYLGRFVGGWGDVASSCMAQNFVTPPDFDQTDNDRKVNYDTEDDDSQDDSDENMPLQVILLEGLQGWSMDDAKLSQAVRSLNPKPLTFHYVYPDLMFTIDHMMKEQDKKRTLIELQRSLAQDSESRRSDVQETDNYYNTYMEDLHTYVHDQNMQRALRISPTTDSSLQMKRMAGVDVKGRVTTKQSLVQPDPGP